MQLVAVLSSCPQLDRILQNHCHAVCNRLVTTLCGRMDPFSFAHNFGKYCPILIILLLLQAEINCDQVYRKIYHHTPNLLVHYLVK